MRCALPLRGTHANACRLRGDNLYPGCQMGSAVPSKCFCAKHAAHLLDALHSLCAAALVPAVLASAGSMLNHCAGTMLQHHLQSSCLLVTPQENACRQTGPACALPAPLTASRTPPLTQVGGTIVCTMSSHQQAPIPTGKPVDAILLLGRMHELQR